MKNDQADSCTDVVRSTFYNSKEALEFEKCITFLFDAKQPELIACHFLAALRHLEHNADQSSSQLEAPMVAMLVTAYTEVQRQTKLQFDVVKAANCDFTQILALFRSKKDAI